MKIDDSAKPGSLASEVASLVPNLETLYKDIHSHPELSLQETRTAAIAGILSRMQGEV